MSLIDAHEPRKIALVVTSQQSATAFISGFANFCADLGYEVVVIASGIEPLLSKTTSGTIQQVPIEMAREPAPLLDLVSLFKLVRVLRLQRPDVLIYGTPKASLLGSLSGAFLRVPTRVYQLRGLRLETVDGFKRGLFAALEKLTSKLSTKVLANSRSLSARYQELKLNAGKQVDLLGLGSSQGVNLNKYSKSAIFDSPDSSTVNFLDSKNSGIVFGFVGRLHADKGISTLLDAMRIVLEEVPNARLLIIGGEEGAELRITGALRESVYLVGQVEDTRPYYSLMDVLVLPSLREGFPNVVLEAAAMEIPSIVSDGTGVVDSVIDEVTGLIATVGSAEEFAAAMVRIAKDPVYREIVGRGAKEHVQKNFDQSLVWSRTLQYFLE